MQGLIKSAVLHDVGKIGSSNNILLKPRKLTDNEFMKMKNIGFNCNQLAQKDKNKSHWHCTIKKF